MKRISPISILAASLLLTGCMSTQKWSSQENVVETPSSFSISPRAELEIKDSLRKLFADPSLDALVESALANNPNLLQSRARMEEIGFNLTRTKSSRLPSLSAGLSALRSKQAGSSPSNLYSADLDASWEVDVWGRIRNSVKASKAELAAAEADYRYAEQSLVAQTMQAWFDLVSAEKILNLDERRVSSFESTERLVSRRFELGESTSSELHLARSDLENARADLESSKNLRDQAARRLNVLTGSYPTTAYDSALNWPSLQNTVAEGLPSDLLAARPDVIAAYERLIASDARIKVSQSDLFPSFKLTANGGRSSAILDNLSDSSFNSWSALAAFSVNLFDAGSRRSEIGAANKRAEQAYYNYQNIVLNAFREVENALGSEVYLANEESARNAALEAANRSLARAQRDYESGLITILSLLETQRRVFTTERQVINLKASRLNNRVSLALALGKGA